VFLHLHLHLQLHLQFHNLVVSPFPFSILSSLILFLPPFSKNKQTKQMASSSSDLKNFFNAQIEANKPPPKPKKERVWTPNNSGTEGAHTKQGYGKQSKVKSVVCISFLLFLPLPRLLCFFASSFLSFSS
jgi:hypothetical protein